MAPNPAERRIQPVKCVVSGVAILLGAGPLPASQAGPAQAATAPPPMIAAIDASLSELLASAGVDPDGPGQAQGGVQKHKIRAGHPAIETKPKSAADFTLSGAIGVVSDYRDRGLSLSTGDPAVQGALTIQHKSGLFALTEASSTKGFGGSDIELTLTLGYGRDTGQFHLEGGVVETLYPGVADANTFEIYGAVSRKLGKAELGLSMTYAPAQDNLGGKDNVYAAAFLEVPLGNSPLTLDGALGLEDGAGGDRKVDWYAGVTLKSAGFELSAGATGAARTFGAPHSGTKAIFSISYGF